jgi:type IV pilus assembly protein PilV
VELLVAMVISIVGLLGLVQAMDYAAVQNLNNQQRDEAVQIAEDQMARFRDVPFSSSFSQLSTTTAPDYGKYVYPTKTVQSRVRSGGFYTVIRTTNVTDADSRVDLGVRVRWKFKNTSTAHEVHSVRYRDAS